MLLWDSKPPLRASSAIWGRGKWQPAVLEWLHVNTSKIQKVHAATLCIQFPGLEGGGTNQPDFHRAVRKNRVAVRERHLLQGMKPEFHPRDPQGRRKPALGGYAPSCQLSRLLSVVQAPGAVPCGTIGAVLCGMHVNRAPEKKPCLHRLMGNSDVERLE